MQRIIFKNARVIRPDEVWDKGCVGVLGGRIEFVSREVPDAAQGDEVDCGGAYLSPGFIDTHCHGGGGADFMDGSAEAVIQAARAHLKHGTTGICPTTLTCSDEELFSFFNAYEEACHTKDHMPHLLGIHLEGPYFAAGRAGAQPLQYLAVPRPEHYLKILSLGGHNIVKWSVAPELPGAMELGDELSARGIIASMGHSDADIEVAKEAMRHGYTELTHFYCAMSSIVREHGHRRLGLVEAGYLYDRLRLEIIADGIHLPPELLRLIVKCKDHTQICLVTDSMRGADMPDGPSLLGSLSHGVPVVIRDGVAHMPSFDRFAGSVATADRLVRVMVRDVRLPVWDAVHMASLNPATSLGIEADYGSIETGKIADLLIFDDDVNISAVYVAGVRQL